MSYESFLAVYDNFIWRWALDGHESDAEERKLLARNSQRIAPHRFIAEEILARLCADADANRGEYVRAGRLGTLEALARLKKLTGVLA